MVEEGRDPRAFERGFRRARLFARRVVCIVIGVGEIDGYIGAGAP